MELAPYLNFSGNCEEAFHFYAKVLNGKITYIQHFGDSPMADRVGPDFAKKVMHATLEFEGRHLYGCDAPPDMQSPMKGFALSLETASPEESEKLFQAIADGGTITMPFQKTFWSSGFGMLKDKYGVPWMVNTYQSQS